MAKLAQDVPPELPVEVLITAEAAFPAFEECVLNANDEIVMGFRIFDPMTRLRSDQARQVGETWCDLLAHVLAKGVRVRLFLSDFDPVATSDLHAACWRSVRILSGVRELAGAGADLKVFASLHPARIGLVPALAFRPLIGWKLRQLARQARKAPRHRVHLPGVAYLRAQLGRLTMPSYPASHHHKLAVIDGTQLYIGGLDLDERRFDDPRHDQPAQDTWHDVQLLIQDTTLARSARAHLLGFRAVTEGRALPPATPGIFRTISAKRHGRPLLTMSPRACVHEILDWHLDQVSRAESLIYLETQFFRHKGIAHALARRAREQPGLKMMIVLPAAPDTAAFQSSPALEARYGDHLQTRCLKMVSDAFGDRLLVASPVQNRWVTDHDFSSDRANLRDAPLIYVHAKVSVFDTRAAMVSSANLNGRSLMWDTEAGVALTDARQVTDLRAQLLRHWYSEDVSPDFKALRGIVLDNARRRPDTRQGFLVPYDMGAARRTAVTVPGIPDEMV